VWVKVYVCFTFFHVCCRFFLCFHLISHLVYIIYIYNIFRFCFCFDSFSVLNDKYMMAKCKKGTRMNMIISTAHEGNTINKWEWHFHRIGESKNENDTFTWSKNDMKQERNTKNKTKNENMIPWSGLSLWL
jgi:hypothetical protein